MTAFAARTGLTTARPAQRYLWTDAFAVCNFLALSRASESPTWKALALQLIESVHRTLGRHRADDVRTGPLSGLPEATADHRPTAGGLRIGKPLPERSARDPVDERLEWERDGQYLHYLTKWMHALDQTARLTAQPQLNRWARELAEVSHARFLRRDRDGHPRLVWKMSIDLSRPLVSATGMHDALDGFLTCAELRWTARALHCEREAPALAAELESFGAMMHAGQWASADPLSLGGLLMDAARVAQLVAGEALPDDGVLHRLLASALSGLPHYARQRELQLPAEQRVPFRELGLAIGLSAVALVRTAVQAEPARFARSDCERLLESLAAYCRLGDAIASFWLGPEQRKAASWRAHLDINEVMLATSLAPMGVLTLYPATAA